MAPNLFKSKKPSVAKGKTIKKAEPAKGGQTSEDKQAGDSARVKSAVDLLSITDWLKESAFKSPQPAAKKEEAGLWELKGPRHATLVPEGATQLRAVSVNGSKEESDFKETETKRAFESDDAEEPEHPMLDLLVGHQNTSSQFFTRTYFRVPNSSVPDISPSLDSSEVLQELTELDPNAFRLYQIWLHTGAILPGYHGAYDSMHTSTSKYKWQLFWPLINAHILGCAIQAVDFADSVIDCLQNKLGTTQADDDTIKHLFSADKKDVSNSLKSFVVDQCVSACVRDSAMLNLSGLPHSFAHLMVERALLRLSTRIPEAAEAGCEYHIHGTREACYKKKVLPKDIRKQQQLEAERKKSRKDYDEITKNSKTNDIHTIDWEQRRAASNRVPKMQPAGLGMPSTTRTQAKRLSDPLADAFFGTTQSLSAIDDVMTKVPEASRAALLPLPSAPTELPLPLADSSNSVKLVPVSKAPATELDGAVVKPVTSNSNSSPVSNANSAQSTPDEELRQNLEMALEFERQNRCPGAFPVSRNGSTRSVAT